MRNKVNNHDWITNGTDYKVLKFVYERITRVDYTELMKQAADFINNDLPEGENKLTVGSIKLKLQNCFSSNENLRVSESTEAMKAVEKIQEEFNVSYAKLQMLMI